MCTECYTRCVRPLVTVPASNGWYYTLRIGEALFDRSPVIICGPQEEIAGFDFHVVDEDGIPRAEATPESDPAAVRAFLRVLKPADWARFLCCYAGSLGQSCIDFEAVVEALETEAAALYRQAVEYARAHPVCPDGDDADTD